MSAVFVTTDVAAERYCFPNRKQFIRWADGSPFMCLAQRARQNRSTYRHASSMLSVRACGGLCAPERRDAVDPFEASVLITLV